MIGSVAPYQIEIETLKNISDWYHKNLRLAVLSLGLSCSILESTCSVVLGIVM